MKRTQHNVVALNRRALSSLRGSDDGIEASAELLGIDSQLRKCINSLSESRFESMIRAVNTPLLTGASINTAAWELLVSEIESDGDIKRVCTRVSSFLRKQNKDE